jgi:hypothetical protein
VQKHGGAIRKNTESYDVVSIHVYIMYKELDPLTYCFICADVLGYICVHLEKNDLGNPCGLFKLARASISFARTKQKPVWKRFDFITGCLAIALGKRILHK